VEFKKRSLTFFGIQVRVKFDAPLQAEVKPLTQTGTLNNAIQQFAVRELEHSK